MKKKLLFFALVLCCIAVNKGYSQVINEGFEETEWSGTTTSSGGTVVITSTSASSTMTYFLNSAGTSSSFSTTGAYTLTVPFASSSSATNSSTRTSYTVYYTSSGINTSPNSGSWLYSRGSIATDSRLQRAHSKQNAWAMGSSSGYLITPVIQGGVASITVWVAAASDFTIGLNTNTSIATLPTYSSNNSSAMGGFTHVTQSFPASGTLGATVMQSFSFTGSFAGPVRVGIFNAGGSNIYVDDIVITSPPPSTALFASQNSLAFGNQAISSNSTSQSFDISGILLTGSPGNITVTAPSTDFQVSNNNTTWGASASIAYASATLSSTTVYVRFTPQTTGAKSGNVTVAGGGATTLTIAVSGTGTGAVYSYRSKQTGNWADASTWEYNNGTTWVNAVAAPSDADGTINVQNAHVVAINAAVNADELTIDAGGRVEVLTGNTLTIANGSGTDITVNGTLKNSGTVTLTGTATLGSAAIYQHDATTAIPTLTWTAGSTCLVTGGSGVPSGGFGQSFSNLTWNCANQSTNVVIASTGFTVTGNFNAVSTGTGGIQMISSGGVTTPVVGSYTQSGGYIYIYPNTAARSLTCNGDFVMTGGNFGITGFLTSAGTGSATLYVKGNINIGNGSTLSRTTGTTANLELNGTSAQNITMGNTVVADTFNTNFNNAAGATLLSPVTLKGNTAFTSGLVNTTNTNLLTIFSSATISGGSNSSFVNGPLQRSVDVNTSTALVFPIGKTTSYSPVTLTITQDAATLTTYKSEAFLSAPASNTLPGTLSKVSDKRYYAITKGSGANVTTAQVQLSYDAADESGTGISLTDKTKIRIAKDNGSGAWLNIGPAAGGSANATGTATSDVSFTSFGQFAIANSSPPVPVKFISFNAQEVNGKTRLSWQVGEEINITGYEVERADANSSNFVSIAQQQANGTNSYTALDASPIIGTNLYRIKAIEKNGSILYSATVKMIKGKAVQTDIAIMPNPVKDKLLTIQLSGYEKGNYSLLLYNAAGMVVCNKSIAINNGNTTMQLELPASLSKGLYQLVVTDGANKKAKAVMVE